MEHLTPWESLSSELTIRPISSAPGANINARGPQADIGLWLTPATLAQLVAESLEVLAVLPDERRDYSHARGPESTASEAPRSPWQFTRSAQPRS